VFVVDEHVLAARHMLANGRDDFVLGDVGRDDAARDLPLLVDPFDKLRATLGAPGIDLATGARG